VDALAEALGQWGDEKGALVVVSHDRNFCDKIPFTHVATVKDGTFKLEERGARESDWIISSLTLSTSATGTASPETESSPAPVKPSPVKDLDPKLRKAAYNAPKRIKKLEDMIEQAERKIAELDELMLANGNDVGRLTDWSKQRQEWQGKTEAYLKEWNELEELLAKVAAASTAAQ
jgi:ABC transport system ATP-binding/permease protein